MVQGAGKSKHIKKQGNEFIRKMQYTLSGGFEISSEIHYNEHRERERQRKVYQCL